MTYPLTRRAWEAGARFLLMLFPSALQLVRFDRRAFAWKPAHAYEHGEGLFLVGTGIVFTQPSPRVFHAVQAYAAHAYTEADRKYGLEETAQHIEGELAMRSKEAPRALRCVAAGRIHSGTDNGVRLHHVEVGGAIRAAVRVRAIFADSEGGPSLEHWEAEGDGGSEATLAALRMARSLALPGGAPVDDNFFGLLQ